MRECVHFPGWIFYDKGPYTNIVFLHLYEVFMAISFSSDAERERTRRVTTLHAV